MSRPDEPADVGSRDEPGGEAADQPGEQSPLLGGLGAAMPLLQGLLSELGNVQELVASTAAESAGRVFEGTAGAGAVRVRVSGELEAVSVHIDPGVVDPSDVGLLEDLVLAAVRDGLGQITELNDDLAGSLGATAGMDPAAVGELLRSIGIDPSGGLLEGDSESDDPAG